MNSTDYSLYEMNRAAHLGQRDFFVQKALDSMAEGKSPHSPEARIEHVARLRYYFQHALEHAVLASKSRRAIPAEQAFIHYLRLLLSCLHSLHRLVECGVNMDGISKGLCGFLADGLPDHEDPARHLYRRSQSILDEVYWLLELGVKPYENLRSENLAAMNEEDRNRYRRAGESLSGFSFVMNPEAIFSSAAEPAVQLVE